MKHDLIDLTLVLSSVLPFRLFNSYRLDEVIGRDLDGMGSERIINFIIRRNNKYVR